MNKFNKMNALKIIQKVIRLFVNIQTVGLYIGLTIAGADLQSAPLNEGFSIPNDIN